MGGQGGWVGGWVCAVCASLLVVGHTPPHHASTCAVHAPADVNHELIGGIYTQQLWGESFEEPAWVGADGHVGLSSLGSNKKPTWFARDNATADCFELVTGDAQTGNQSQKVSVGSQCGVVNRGLDGGGPSLQPPTTHAFCPFFCLFLCSP